ncbi:Na+/H+ antiporter subunit E [Pseudoroseomonas cervicalis]|uniref:Na+/H+ antiporter subunit E n=1 Tax=Teichococcus cervicalis TaxID=204525 RepID=UPI00277FEF04|nr:Na+/H+ antiporter subunit E [Pseudoroseomonas cervicalis]MDQ1081504.1 multicomponent Na+:H+ antiporter subunit E [Pseudoroseomonas cervicalis]
MRPALSARLGSALMLALVFLRELALSCVAVAAAAFARQPRTAPAILAVPIDLRSDLGIAMLANLTTLTPGTCSLHVSADRRLLYIHVLDARDPDAVVAGIQTAFAARIRRIEG